MRVLFTCAGGYGHIHPMVPLAGALERAGHDVAFATVRLLCPRLERAGFTAFPAGLGGRELAEETARRHPELADVPVRDQLDAYLARMSAGVAAPAMADDLWAVVASWRPDLLIHDPSEFAGPLVAAKAGIPWANHSWGPMFAEASLAAAAAVLVPLWHAWGVSADPLESMFRHLFLDVCPRRLQPEMGQQVRLVQPLRPVPFDAVGDEALPPWVSSLPDRPVVYVTLGTLFNQDRSVFAAIVEGLRDEPVEVVVTVGHFNDPTALGPQPRNVHVERYIPQSLLLPRCAMVVNHGGAGSMLAALSHGLPLLVVPQGADQFDNAQRCVSAGAARSLARPELTPGSVQAEAHLLLGAATFGLEARRIRQEILEMPPPDQVVPVLERLAQEGSISRS